MATSRLTSYVGIASVALLIGVATGRPDVALLGLPFGAVVVVGLAGRRATAGQPPLSVAAVRSTDAAVEGEEVDVVVTLRGGAEPLWVEVDVPIRDALPPATGPASGGFGLGLAAAAERQVVVTLACRRWGTHRIGPLRVTAYDRFRLFVWRGFVPVPGVVRVHPTAARLRALVHPDRLVGLAGSHPSRLRAEGIDYADTRPYVPGDRLRSVNWRVSGRREGLWVDDRHPDRSGDVVLLLDSFAAAGWTLDSTLDMAVDAVLRLAETHGRANDRVGLVGLGGVLRWVSPGMGAHHRHRVVEAVLDTEVLASVADKGVDVIPVRALPARALVVMVSPMLDPRSHALAAELWARRFDLAVVECSPMAFAEPDEGVLGDLSYRLWRLDREARRHELRAAGIPLIEWERGTDLGAALDEVIRWRRLPRVGGSRR